MTARTGNLREPRPAIDTLERRIRLAARMRAPDEHISRVEQLAPGYCTAERVFTLFRSFRAQTHAFARLGNVNHSMVLGSDQ